jgi:hypothetical protein
MGGGGETLEDFLFPYSMKVILRPKLGLFRGLCLTYFWFSFLLVSFCVYEWLLTEGLC